MTNDAGDGRQPPIFVLGITGRSGTNYLRDLIAVHPQCVTAKAPIWEDFLLDQVKPLLEYAERLQGKWASWGDGAGSDLLPVMGEALTAYLSPDSGRHLVTKTPSVRNLDRFFDVFPSARLVIIVRDPRSVVESAVKSFDADYEGWARDWARGAARILEFRRRSWGDDRVHHLVRYEDVIEDMRGTLTALFTTIGLDVAVYDFAEAENLPVRGSSQLASDGDMHWQPVTRSSDFDPLRRWEHWPTGRLQRVEWIAGPAMEALGYERIAEQPNGFVQRVRDGALLARLARRQALRRARRH